MQYANLFLFISINVKFCPFLKISVYKHFYSCNVNYIFLLTLYDFYYLIIYFLAEMNTGQWNGSGSQWQKHRKKTSLSSEKESTW